MKNIAKELKRIFRKGKRSIAVLLILCMVANCTIAFADVNDFSGDNPGQTEAMQSTEPVNEEQPSDPTDDEGINVPSSPSETTGEGSDDVGDDNGDDEETPDTTDYPDEPEEGQAVPTGDEGSSTEPVDDEASPSEVEGDINSENENTENTGEEPEDNISTPSNVEENQEGAVEESQEETETDNAATPSNTEEIQVDGVEASVATPTNIAVKSNKIVATKSFIVATSSKLLGGAKLLGGTTTNTLCFTSNADGSKVGYTKIGTLISSNFYTSTDGSTWSSLWDGTAKTLNKGQKLFVKGDNASGIGSDIILSYMKFQITGNVSASGNIMGLIDNGACTTTTIPNRCCFNHLFLDCTGLVSAPELPATNITDYCYYSMFTNTSLKTVPTLPATTLAECCYCSMFSYCTSLILKKSPSGNITKEWKIPTNTEVSGCKDYMFYESTNVDLDGSGGKDCSLNTTYYTLAPSSSLCFTSNEDGSEVSYTKNGTLDTLNMQKSTDGYSWSTWDGTNVTLDEDEKLYVKGDNASGLSNSTSNYLNFNVTTGNVSASGNIMGLLDNDACTTTTIPNSYCFYKLFDGCTNLVSAPELPATTLTAHCYESMFSGCTSLTEPATLPATDLAESCYASMFSGCTSLILKTVASSGIGREWKVPATAAATNWNQNMFNGCTNVDIGTCALNTIYYISSLKTLCFTSNADGSQVGYTIYGTLSPNIMKSTDNGTTWTSWDGTAVTLASGEKMYVKGDNASGLSNYISSNYNYVYFNITTGNVSASGNIMGLIDNGACTTTTIPNAYCFLNLFKNCTGLVSAPELPATDLTADCYEYMFYKCTSLTTVPALPAETLADSCYMSMFRGCTSLTTVPTLSATTLNRACYQYMFDGCTSLMAVPKIVATNFSYIQCCAYMFRNCTSLFLKTSASGDITKEWKVTGTSMTNWNLKMFNGCPSVDPNGETACTIGTTYYTLADGATTKTLCFTSNADGSEVGYSITNTSGGTTITPQFWTSKDGSVWSSWTGTSITINDGEKLYVKGNNASGINKDNNYMTFSITGNVSASGNIMGLIDNGACTTTTIPSERCFQFLFQNCTGLVSAPELPATTLTACCYNYMFSGCASLTTAPTLPATTIAAHCYAYMFSYCTSLTTAPELLATSLPTHCYWGMFRECTSLTTAPLIPATTLEYRCCCRMFQGCTSLILKKTSSGDITKEWKIPATSGDDWNYEMFTDCLSSVDFNGSGGKTCALNTTYYTLADGATTKTLCFTSNEDGSVVGYTKTGTPTSSNFYTSSDGKIWSSATWVAGSSGNVTLNKGEKLYVKGNNASGISKDSSNYVKFNITTGNVSASGNIMGLIDNGACTTTTIPNNYCFSNLFNGCTNLVSAPELPATTLTQFCYVSLFYGCTSLATASELPATNLGDSCYQSMFSGCTSLTTAPELPATTLKTKCYYSMFYGCTSLATASTLQATELKEYCYCSMFAGCTSLTTAPALPATTLADYCYYSMFSGCTSLTIAPVLPATTLKHACYYYMFKGCTSLTKVPALPATTLANSCYGYMFQNCTSLVLKNAFSGDITKEWKIPATSGAGTGNTVWNKMMFDGCPNVDPNGDGACALNTTYYTKGETTVKAATPSDAVEYGFITGALKINVSESTNIDTTRYKISNYKYYECTDASGSGATQVDDVDVSDEKSHDYEVPSTATSPKAVGDYYYYARVTYVVDNDTTNTFTVVSNIVKATVKNKSSGSWGGCPLTYDTSTNTLTITGSATSTSGTLATAITNSLGSDIRSEIKNVKCVNDASGNKVKVGNDAGTGTFSGWTALETIDLENMDLTNANTDFTNDLFNGDTKISEIIFGADTLTNADVSTINLSDKIWVGSDNTFYTTSTPMLTAQKTKAATTTYGEYKCLAVKTPATKSAYKIGDTFKATGSVLTAKYNDTVTYDIDYDTHSSDITYSPTTALTSSDNVITYTYLGKTATQSIVFGSPISITYKSGPTKSSYRVGETFDPTGLVITENYNYDLPSSDVTYDSSTSGQFTLSPAKGSLLNAAGSKSLTIGYGGYSTTKDAVITVENPSSISVATNSTITHYAAGDKFIAKGLYINRNFASAASDTVKFDDHTADFTFGPNGDFSRNTFKTTDTYVSIKYGGQTTTQAITIKAVSSITVSAPPSKTTYTEGESFDPSGMEITATYNDPSSTTEVITYDPSVGITYTPTTFATTDTSVTVTYEGKSTTITGITVNEKTMSAISVKTTPTKTTYIEGATFDPAGLVITKTYDNGTTENVTYNNSTSANFTFTPDLTTALNTVGTKAITITYQDTYGTSPTTKTTTMNVVVKAKTLKSISVASKSTTTTYIEGNTFAPAGIKIYRNYDNGTKDVYDYDTHSSEITYSPSVNLVKGTQAITLNYSGFTTSFNITVNAKSVSSLAIGTAPKKLTYLAGDKVNADGLVLNATYDNGDTETVTYGTSTGISYSPTTALATTDTQITFTYGGQSVTQNITVNEVPTSIDPIGTGGTTAPTKTSYVAGEKFDPTGLTLNIPNWGGGSGGTITYSEGCGMTFSPSLDTPITSTTTQITVTYGGQTIVIPITPATLDSISVSSGPTKTSYKEGEKFDPAGLVLTLTYLDTTTATVTYKDGCGMTYTPTTAFTTLGTNTVTINYAGKSCTKDINVVAKSVSGVSLNTVQSKRTYIEGNNYDPAGLKLNITYDNGTSEVVSYSSDTSSKFTFNPSLTTALTSGTQNITITYDGNANTVSTTVLATAKSVTSIAVNTAPTTTTYIEGNTFDPAGLKLDVTYDNGTTAVVDYASATSDFAFSPSTFTSVGTQNVTITYGGKTVTTPVTVNAKQVSSIAVTTDPSKMTYLEGETFNADGTVLALTYDNGTTGTLTYSASSGITYDKTTLTNATDNGTKVTFTYNGKTAQTSANLVVNIQPTSIDVTATGTSLPTRTSFAVGEAIDLTGLVIHIPGNTPDTLTYSETSGIEVIPSGALTSSDTVITIKYGNVTTTIPINVKSLYDLSVDTNPTKMTYIEGEVFDPTGLVLGLTFSDDDTGTKKYTINSGIGYSYGTTLLGSSKLLGAKLLGDSSQALTVGQQKVNFTYNGLSTYTYVTVNPKSLNGININTAPTKVSYNEGDLFDPTGLVLGLTYDNGTTGTLNYSASSGITYDKTTALTTTDTTVTFTYSDGTNSYTATQAISVAPAVSSIAKAVDASKLTYKINESFDPTGLVLGVTYSDSTTKYVPYTTSAGMTFNPTTKFTSSGTQNVNIIYSGKTTTQTVTVTEDVSPTPTPTPTPTPSPSYSGGGSSGGGGGGRISNIVTEDQRQMYEQITAQTKKANDRLDPQNATTLVRSANTEKVIVSNGSNVNWIYEPTTNKWKLSINDSYTNLSTQTGKNVTSGFVTIAQTKTTKNTMTGVNNVDVVASTYFFDQSGEMHIGWLTTGDLKTYYFETAATPDMGKMVSGWREIENNWFYFDSTGVMFRNAVTPDGYNVDANGVWVK